MTGLVRLRFVGRVLLAAATLTTVATLPVTPGAQAATAAPWSSQACSPAGSTCSFPAQLGGQVNLNAVSCSSAGNCVAVGNYVDSESGSEAPCPVSVRHPKVKEASCSLPVIETLSNGVWKATTPPHPKPYPGVAGSAYMSGTLSGVSCTSTTSCIAVGSETPLISPNGFDRYAFAEVLSGGAWTPVGPFPYPGCLSAGKGPFCAQSGGTLVTMNAVSCVSATSCVAVGQDKVKAEDSSTGRGGYQGVAYTLQGSPLVAAHWKPSYNLTAAPQYNVTLEGVSCTALSTCVAVGSTTVQSFSGSTPIYHLQPLAETLAGATWTDISPLNPGVASSATLAAVACISKNSCEAVGSFTGSSSGGGRTGALAESLSGTTWTPTTNLETTADGASTAGFTGISCTAGAACEAVGQYADTQFQEHALVANLSGGGWTTTTGIDPPADSNPTLTAVSCPTAGHCQAVGNATTAAGGIGPFVSAQQQVTTTILLVSVPGTVTSGKPFGISVTAQNCVNGACVNATGYHGSVHFTSSDAGAILPSDSSLSNGGGTFTVTLDTGKTSSTATITATDTFHQAITGTSRSITINPAPSAPSPPQYLHATGGAEVNVLGWYPPAANGLSTITGYVIFRGTSPGGGGAVTIGRTSHTLTSFADRPPIAGVRYFYAVEAVNKVGASAPSNEAAALVTGSLAGARRFASDPSGHGYWMTSMNGGVFAFGNAGYYGSPGPLHQPYVSMASTPDGRGYWVAAADGTVFAFGDAPYFGSARVAVSQPIVGMVATRDGRGYWLAAANGTVHAFGDAPYYGSARVAVSQPIVGMAATPNSNGYWLVGADGRVFVFGAARFHGSAQNARLVEPICGMATTADGRGYWLVGVNGAIFPFGDATSLGGLANQLIMWPIAGMLPNMSGPGYRFIDWVGNPIPFGP